jgi:hypothetical protein
MWLVREDGAGGLDVPLDISPFPPLSWTGFAWSARATVPGFPQHGTMGLEVRVPPPAGTVDEAAAPRPTAEQAAAYRFLLGDGPGVLDALLTALRDRVPEWAEWPLGRVADEARLDGLTVHAAAWDGAAYIGYWLSPAKVDSWLSEHGAGVTAHRYRVVAVGMAEEARDGAAAAADVRRLRRSHRGLPPRRG